MTIETSKGRIARLTGVLATSALALGLVAASASAAVPQGPSGDAFYDYTGTLPTSHGKVLRARIAPPAVRIKAARTTKLVLYTSTAPDGSIVETSGLVALPKVSKPKGLITWAHGTTGIGDRCAPSRGEPDVVGTGAGYIAYQNATVAGYLNAGYAVAMTDYQGLGTPGTHPFLIGVSEGRSVLDIVPAAREIFGRSKIGSSYAIAGHSQGGHAALWASEEAKDGYLPAKANRLVGTVAYAPASNIGLLARNLNLAPDAAVGLGVLIGKGVATQMSGDLTTKLNPRIIDDSDSGLAQNGSSLWDIAGVGCSSDVGKLAVFDATTNPDGIRVRDLFGTFDNEAPGLTPDYSDPVLAEFLQIIDDNNPVTGTDKPLFIPQGEADETVIPLLTNLLDGELTAAGTQHEYKKYAGIGHNGIVSAAKKDVLKKLRAWF